MLIIKFLVGFLFMFIMFCIINVVLEEDDAYPVCKIVVGIMVIIFLMLFAYNIGELFL